MTYTALAWNQLLIEAAGLGRRMKVLTEAINADPALRDEYDGLCGVYEEDPAELHRKMWGIKDVLGIIGETPNAYINAEAMAALRCEMNRAVLIEKEAKPILDKIEPPMF